MAGLEPVAAGQKSHKLWGGRFSVPTAAALDALNRSIGIDFRLWPHDVRLSQAWAMALSGAGVLTLDESREIESGLSRVGARLADGALLQTSGARRRARPPEQRGQAQDEDGDQKESRLSVHLLADQPRT